MIEIKFLDSLVRTGVALNSYYLPTGTKAETISLRSVFPPSAVVLQQNHWTRETYIREKIPRSKAVIARGSRNENKDACLWNFT